MGIYSESIVIKSTLSIDHKLSRMLDSDKEQILFGLPLEITLLGKDSLLKYSKDPPILYSMNLKLTILFNSYLEECYWEL